MLRLIGFAVASSAEGDAALNPVQYAVPLIVILICLGCLARKKQLRFGQKRREKAYRAAKIARTEAEVIA